MATLFPLLDDWIHFQFGAPGPDLLPTTLIQDSTCHALKCTDVLQYGPMRGDPFLLERLSHWLSVNYNDVVTLSSLSITSGASQSFSNILTWFTTPQTIVLMENPTYFLAIRVLQDHGIDTVTSIPVDTDGLDIDFLEQTLQSISKPVMPKGRYPLVLYLVPTFSNPTGSSLSSQRRARLVQLAFEHDMLVVCDDVYQLLPFSNHVPPHRLIHYEQAYISQLPLEEQSSIRGHIVSNGSFSKILGPGLRLGWTETHPSLCKFFEKSGLLYSGGCPNQFTSQILSSALELNLVQPHLDRVRLVYQERCLALFNALEKHLGGMIEMTMPNGGYFIWIKLRNLKSMGITTTDLMNFLNSDGDFHAGSVDWSLIPKERVSFTPGNAFSTDASHGEYLRLSFGMFSSTELEEGAHRLSKVIRALYSK